MAQGIDPATLPLSVRERMPTSWQLVATVVLLALGLLALLLVAPG